MTLKYLPLALVASCLLSVSAMAKQAPSFDEADLKVAAELRDQALNSSLDYEIVESITTEVGPRMAGTPGDAAAVKWGVAKLKELGFDKVWTSHLIRSH